MESEKILKEFVDTCSKKIDLSCIMQFGSSTYSKEAKDIDIVLFSKEMFFRQEDYTNLFIIIKSLERRYKEVVFDIGGGLRKRKGKIKITLVPIGFDTIKKVQEGKNPPDPFFIKNLSEDNNRKVLCGSDPTINLKIDIAREQLFNRLEIEINHSLRRYLDDRETRLDAVYFLFKTTLRLMLTNEGSPSKDDLITHFEKGYPEIKLPQNSRKLLNKKLSEKDTKTILGFSLSCLECLNNQE